MEQINDEKRETSKQLITKLKTGIITTEDLLNILQTSSNEVNMPRQLIEKKNLVGSAQGREFRDQ
jgi:hypothetical protein